MEWEEITDKQFNELIRLEEELKNASKGGLSIPDAIYNLSQKENELGVDSEGHDWSWIAYQMDNIK